MNTADFDVHPASETERLAIYRNVHDVWGGGLSLEEHVARRVNSVQHQRAEWFAGVLDGRVVASLGCHPLEFLVHGEVVPGFSIGAVHTVAECRGLGLAPRMLAAVEAEQRDRGRRWAMLFSDIGLTYYERGGYVAGRSHLGQADVAATKFDGRLVAGSDSDYDIRRAECQGRHVLSIRRTAEYAAHLVASTPGQRRFLVENVVGESLGGLSLVVREGRATIEESFARDEPAASIVLRGVHAAAASIGATSVGGWIPDTPATREAFDVQPRDDELTMLKSLDETLPIDAEVLAATDWLDGIDHV